MIPDIKIDLARGRDAITECPSCGARLHVYLPAEPLAKVIPIWDFQCGCTLTTTGQGKLQVEEPCPDAMALAMRRLVYTSDAQRELRALRDLNAAADQVTETSLVLDAALFAMLESGPASGLTPCPAGDLKPEGDQENRARDHMIQGHRSDGTPILPWAPGDGALP
ncbi:hypothetical protein [Maricaulis sp.]|uniref:hypothetical protein n=1 Tax=Maricaulis sp. TaxID=1486257 RepID=UPI003A944F5C